MENLKDSRVIFMEQSLLENYFIMMKT